MSESNMYITFLRYLQISECVEEIKGDRIMKMIRLVGCDVAGGFFVEHCVSIETKATNTLTVKEVRNCVCVWRLNSASLLTPYTGLHVPERFTLFAAVVPDFDFCSQD